MRRRAASLGALLIIVGPFVAAEVCARGPELIEASDQRLQSQTEYIRYRMELIDDKGVVQQTRIMDIYEKHYSDRDVSLQKFRSPPVVEGTGMMIVDTRQASNDIWMYSPATRRLRRIAGAEKRNWYMGTEFTYEDFEDYQIGFYDFSLTATRPCEPAKRCYVIEASPATAAEKKASGYAKKIYWLETETLYPVRVEYISRDKGQIKTLEASGLSRFGSYWRPRQLTMHNRLNGRRTRITVLARKVDEPLDDYYVSKRYLRTD